MHTGYTTTKHIASQWYTMNIDYKFLCIWISSFSLSEYVVEMYSQQYDIASGGQWRPRTYFSWYTSSFILNDGVYDVIESIYFSRSLANLQHFNIKCLTVSGSLEQSGQVDSIFYCYEMLLWYSYQFLTWGKCFVFGGSVYYGYTNHGPDYQKFLSM